MSDAPVKVVAPIQRVGDRLAVFIPAEQAREAGLREGQTVEASILPRGSAVLGLLKGVVPYAPFERRKEEPAGDPL